MTTLHSINSAIKAFLKWTTILAASIILIILLIKVGFALKEFFFPTPLPPPTESFGKLPEIPFPKTEQEILEKVSSYSLDTLTGKLPELPDRIEVFRIESYKPNLLALERTKKIVERIGFKSKEKKVSDILYFWETSPYQKKIEYNILTSNFKFLSDYFYDERVLNSGVLNLDQSMEAAFSFFNTVSSFPNDIDTSKTKTSFFTIENNLLVPTTSLSNAKILRVSLFQKDVNNLPIFYEKPDQSNIYALVGNGDYNEKQIVEANFLHHNISSNSATYYIKKPEEAFTLLKKGQAFIADYKGEKKEISIKNVFLAYYLPKKEVNFLMPIIVFEGNDGFYAYILAIQTD